MGINKYQNCKMFWAFLMFGTLAFSAFGTEIQPPEKSASEVGNLCVNLDSEVCFIPLVKEEAFIFWENRT